MNRYLTLTTACALGLVCTISMSGCDAGNGSGLDQNGQPLAQEQPQTAPSTPAPDTPPTPAASLATLQAIQTKIFDQYCTQCHAGANAPLGLKLDSLDNSFNLLVNQSSVELPQFLRVNPGDPDNSYLVKKLEGASDIVGAQMPLGANPLTAEEIALVRQWISEGAMP